MTIWYNPQTTLISPVQTIEVIANILLGHRKRAIVASSTTDQVTAPAPTPPTAGKSAAGNVDKVKRLRPAFSSPPAQREFIVEPRKHLQISTSLCGYRPHHPHPPPPARHVQPVQPRGGAGEREGFVSRTSNTFDKMGSVCRRSTTATKFNGLMSASRAMENFMFSARSVFCSNRAVPARSIGQSGGHAQQFDNLDIGADIP